jgi:hypothetical protein
MLTTFTLLVVTGGILRLALGWGLHRRYQLDLSVLQINDYIILENATDTDAEI